MLKKRLIGVVTIKEQWAVQSIGYNRYYPLGKPECLIENLDRWGADEILVKSIDRTSKGLGPDFNLLDNIAKLGIKTPLIYGGGISTIEDSIRVIQSGADRIILDSILHNNVEVVGSLSEQLGAQAIIASLPLAWNGASIECLNYRQMSSKEISRQIIDLLNTRVVSEVLLIDWKHEGLAGSFQQTLIKHFPVLDMPLIVFGGISDLKQIETLFTMKNVSAVAMGNFLNYKEHAIQKIKASLSEKYIRLPIYEKDSI